MAIIFFLLSTMSLVAVLSRTIWLVHVNKSVARDWLYWLFVALLLLFGLGMILTVPPEILF